MKTELVTTLKRQATKILADLRKTKEPVLITEHGKPSAYLVDVGDYEMTQRRVDMLEKLLEAEMDIASGRVYTQEEMEAEFEKKWPE
ncbi:MAG: type II toxin-antitoxin system Phd/YefM family antitoxin [Candidatus Dadabacteria bacterium]|nr:type II toxin-antitoxin system Phd/YefM family antitoxin [Candidatus Dadabacteria bacterium]